MSKHQLQQNLPINVENSMSLRAASNILTSLTFCLKEKEKNLIVDNTICKMRFSSRPSLWQTCSEKSYCSVQPVDYCFCWKNWPYSHFPIISIHSNMEWSAFIQWLNKSTEISDCTKYKIQYERKIFWQIMTICVRNLCKGKKDILRVLVIFVLPCVLV